jgi:phosphate transport system substrate-binding protein
MARSSRGPNAGETNTMNFWAYALGAVDFVTFPGTNAPAAGLTQQQVINIYTCDPNTGAPFASDWSQVGGKPGTIVKYAPQAGSGTLSFFGTKILNGATVDKNCNFQNMSISLEEHDARGVSAANKPNAIYMYDWARFRAQKTSFEKNLTNGAVLGKFGVNTPVLPSASNVNETSSRFFGTRYVFNVVRKTNHPGQAADQLNSVTRLIGVRTTKQGGAQYICSGKAKADITKAGFVPLVKFGTGGVGLPSSFCRLNPKPL